MNILKFYTLTLLLNVYFIAAIGLFLNNNDLFY